MSKYSPARVDATAMVFTASAAITGGQLVTITGDRQVGPSGAGPDADSKVVGVALDDAAANAPVAVLTAGVHRHVPDGTVAPGDPVRAGSATEVTVWVSGTDSPACLLGIALGTDPEDATRVLWRWTR